MMMNGPFRSQCTGAWDPRPPPWMWSWLRKLTQKFDLNVLGVQEGRTGGLGESIHLWNEQFPNPIWHIIPG